MSRMGGASRGRLLALLGVLALVVTGCGGLFTARSDPGPPLPTPQASFSAGVDAAVAQVRAALEAQGIGVFPPAVPVRPSEPASLVQAPRAVLQAAVRDPDGGYVVVYQLEDPEAARAAAQELADYLASGFGQTNFPVDTQFSVASSGSAVILTWWSREKAEDDELAERAFTAIGGIGESVRVVK